MSNHLRRFIAIVMLVGLSAHVSHAVTLPDPFTQVEKPPFGDQSVAVRYADFYSYSLPLLSALFDESASNGPYAVKSSPGQLKDDLVILTGAGGQTPNNQGRLFGGDAVVDNAYEAPEGAGATSFSTFDVDNTSPDPLTGNADPGGGSEFTGDQSNTWDIQLNSLHSFLAPGGDRSELVFFFNHNEDNGADDQDLWAFLQVSLRDSTGVNDEVYFDLLGDQQILQIDGGVDQYTNTVGEIAPTFDDDFVLAAGELATPFGPTINHNLGADQATYAIFAPELDAFLDLDAFGGYDTMSVSLKLNEIDNGYEQLFIRRTTVEQTDVPPDDEPPSVVPEPATAALSLLGLGALAASFNRRRRPRA